MNETRFLSIAHTGFAVAFLHATTPTHWLPFVLTARGRRWSAAKTLRVTAFASLGHVLFTIALGGLWASRVALIKSLAMLCFGIGVLAYAGWRAVIVRARAEFATAQRAWPTREGSAFETRRVPFWAQSFTAREWAWTDASG